MTVKNIEDLFSRALPYAQDCPEPTLLRFMRDAARDFCRRTRLWKDTDAFTIATPESEGVCTIQDADLYEILSCLFETDTKLKPVTVAWLNAEYPDWQYDSDTACPRFVTQLAPNTVTLYPRDVGTLQLSLVLMPSATAETLPDFIVDQYGQDICDGALGNILLMPNQDWTNPALSQFFMGRFERRLGELSVKASKGQQRARLHNKSQYF